MYLHSQGDPEASFTKEDMQLGRHQEYERRLIEEFNREERERRKKMEVKEVKKEEQRNVVEPPRPPSEESSDSLPESTESEKIEKLEDLFESSLDFDPFYETQKAFESIIQQEIQEVEKEQKKRQNWVSSPPPGFSGGLWQRDNVAEWIDPAIIYSSGGGRGVQGQVQQVQVQSVQQQEVNGGHVSNVGNVGHLLGNSLLNDIFSSGQQER